MMIEYGADARDLKSVSLILNKGSDDDRNSYLGYDDSLMRSTLEGDWRE